MCTIHSYKQRSRKGEIVENKDFQSFETVDLISPVELTPIQGIEDQFRAPDNVEEFKKTPEGTDDTPKKEDPEDNRNRMFNPFRDEAWRYYNSNDPGRFFREEEALRRKSRDKKRTRNELIVIGIIFSLLMLVIIYVIRFSIVNSFNEKKNKVISNDAGKNTVVMNNYIGQDEIYGKIGFDEIPVSDLAEFNPEIIEYTGMYERSLYFMATPKENNVVVEVEVEMIDRYGNSSEKIVNSMVGVPAGREGILQVSFGIKPYDDLNGVTYRINCNAFQVDTEIPCKDITEVHGQDGVLWVKIEGDETANKYAYVVFYKDENVVSVLYEPARHGLEDIAVFETGQIDFDYMKIYY